MFVSGSSCAHRQPQDLGGLSGLRWPFVVIAVHSCSMEVEELRERMRRRWARFIVSLVPSGIPMRGSPEEVFKELDRNYSEEDRWYHNWAHVRACLIELESARDLALHPKAVEMALWFHDAVYSPRAADNEQLSARMARSAAEVLSLPQTTAEEVEFLILSTRHFIAAQPVVEIPTPLCPDDGALIRDIDLSIFGKSREQFDRYEEAVRREYGFVPEGERRMRRIAILEEFLARPSIFETEYFQNRYELKARRNLNRSLSRLRKRLSE